MLLRKAFVLVLVSFCFTSFLSAQDALKQGVYYLSGSVAFSSGVNESGRDYQDKTEFLHFAVQPSFNYFVIDNLSFGASVGFWYTDHENTYSYFDYQNVRRTSTHNWIFRTFGIGPGIRYYFPGSTLVPLIGVSASYAKSGGEGSYQEGSDFTFYAGINYFLSRSAAIEPFISYSIGSMNKPEQDTKSFSIGIRTNYFIVN